MCSTISALEGYSSLRSLATSPLVQDSPKDLWKRIDKLFERRNALAHRGKRPSEAEVHEAISASRDVFAWLAALKVSDD